MIVGSNISVVILTLNEACNLERCIESLRWCEQIIVLDSGSNDQTESEARRLGASFYVHQQKPPFKIDEQRNWALDNCKIDTEWVLFLDADETVNDTLRKILMDKCAKSSESDLNAYELTPRYIFWGTWLKRTQGYPNWHARFLKHKEVRFTGGVWEHFDENARVGRILAPYDHYANSKGFEDWLQRHNRYSSWDAERIVNYLDSGTADSLETSRKLKLRLCAARFWPLRPFARFFHMYFIRRGIFEGIPALMFCMMYFFYEFMTVIKICELRRLNKNLDL